MRIWTKKNIIIAASLVVLILASVFTWKAVAMGNMISIRAGECQCGPIMLEQEVANANQIFKGTVSRISKHWNGSYTVTIKPKEFIKGNKMAEQELLFDVDGACPYPFQKNIDYIFVQPSKVNGRYSAKQCAVIINAADVETVKQIREWVNSDEDEGAGDAIEPNVPAENGTGRLFEAVQSAISSIRVEEAGFKSWQYHMDDPLFFYSPDVKITFFLPIEEAVSREDYEAFTEGITITSDDGGTNIPFTFGEINLDSLEIPLIIKLNNAPAKDLLVTFNAPDGEEKREFVIQYIEPFTYTVSSKQDLQIDNYVTLLRNGYFATHYVENGQSYTYDIHFNHPVDRTSVFEKLEESLFNLSIAWTVRWIDDYEVNLTLKFDDHFEESVTLFLNGVRTSTGYMLESQEFITIQPTDSKVFAAVDLNSNTKESYFLSLTPFSSIDVSPNGQYVMVSEEGNNGLSTVNQYVVMDIFGNALKRFQMDEISDPTWLGDGDAFAYVKGNQLLRYDLETGKSTVLWSQAVTDRDEYIVSFDYYAPGNIMAVGFGYLQGDGRYNYDMNIIRGFADSQPLKLSNFGTFECYEGACMAPSSKIIDDHTLVYTKWESRSDGHIETYVPVLHRIDLVTLEQQVVDIGNGIGEDNNLVYALPDGRVLQVKHVDTSAITHDPFDTGKEQWSVYDPGTGLSTFLLETSIDLFDSNWLQRVIPLENGQVLIHVYGDSWYVLDIAQKTMRMFTAVPGNIDVIDVEYNRIWYLEK